MVTQLEEMGFADLMALKRILYDRRTKAVTNFTIDPSEANAERIEMHRSRIDAVEMEIDHRVDFVIDYGDEEEKDFQSWGAGGDDDFDGHAVLLYRILPNGKREWFTMDIPEEHRAYVVKWFENRKVTSIDNVFTSEAEFLNWYHNEMPTLFNAPK